MAAPRHVCLHVFILLFLMAQVMVDGRGHIDWQQYGPKERRKRQSKFIIICDVT